MPRGKVPSTKALVPGPIAEMPYHLLRDTSVDAAAKVVYLALRHNALAWGRKDLIENKYLWVGIDRMYLLRDSGLNREAFRRGLAKLEQRGWVAVIRPNEDETTVIIDGQERTFRVDRDEPLPYPSTYILLAG